ncbi:MAG: MmcQ/YjbR family DNA-binding protein [Rhodothermales bacterium]
MTLDALRDYCLSQPGATEDQPFGPDTLVFKVMGKLFALVNLDGPPFSVNLKCDPEQAVELRERYAAVVPGYHMNKRHWNTVDLSGDASSEDLREWIDHSYSLVVKSLKKADREALGR